MARSSPARSAPNHEANRRAVLIFAAAVDSDLQRRRFPKRFRALLDFPSVNAAELQADLHLFTSTDTQTDTPFTVHPQVGETFAERLESAAERLVQLGYEELVLIGRDCPHLREKDIATAFEALGRHRLVLGPDHRGGCYLIALRAVDHSLLTKIRWQANSDFAQLRNRAGATATKVLATKLDVDSWRDLFLLAVRDAQWRDFFRRWLLEHGFRRMAFHQPRVDAWREERRVTWQMPPPAFA